MKIIRQLDRTAPDLRGCALAIGNFDGVHQGHARLVERLVAHARQLGGQAIVFTFDPHPVRILRPETAPPPLTWTDRKAQLLEELGVDVMVAYPTDEALLALGPREFFDLIVRKQLDARAMIEGPNFFFGHDRQGTIDVLRRLTGAAGIPLEVVPPIEIDGQLVSSSRIRQLICAGKIDEASQLLTRPYRIRGMVTHGAGRGAKLGFPTANIDAIDTLLPGFGVYAGRAYRGDIGWPAAINVGPNPTFSSHALKVEVHLIGFNESLYGEPLEVDFRSRLRDIHAFPSVDALKTQLQQDIAAAERIADESRTTDQHG